MAEAYPLHQACRANDRDRLATLLRLEVFKVNQGNYDLIRPLHEACLVGSYDCCLLLCDHGADIHLKNIDGATALSDACAKGSLECIHFLLQRGAAVNIPFLLITPLHEAVLGNNWHCIAPLLQHGASLEASDLDFGTPLQVAVCKGFIECARILLVSGANVNASKNHQTPLLTSAQRGDLEMVRLLLEHGADVYRRNGRGKTARQLVPNNCLDCKLLIEVYEYTPRSLRQVCRFKIRESVGTGRLTSLKDLKLPLLITRFLDFS